MGLRQVIAHIAALVEGQVAGAVHAIAAGHFRPTDLRTPIEEYPAAGATRRYELLWTRIADGQPTTGETAVSGNIVDSNADLVLAVIYHAGGGRDRADRVALNRLAADDWTRLRRCLVHGANYDEPTTGLENLRMGAATIGPSRSNPDLVMMTIPLFVQFREDWTLEVAEPAAA